MKFFDLIKLFFDWLVLPIAAPIAYVMVCLIGMAILTLPLVAWHWTVELIEREDHSFHHFPARPHKFSTGVIAGIAALYGFAVILTALYLLPRVISVIMTRPDLFWRS